MNRDFTLQLVANPFGACEDPLECGKLCHCGEVVDGHPTPFECGHMAVPMHCRACTTPDSPGALFINKARIQIGDTVYEWDSPLILSLQECKGVEDE